jgi:hypothetical protein
MEKVISRSIQHNRMPQYSIIKDTASKHRQISDGFKFLLARDKYIAAHVIFLKTMHNIRISGDEHISLFIGNVDTSESIQEEYIVRFNRKRRT